MPVHAYCGKDSINNTLCIRVTRNYTSDTEEGWIMPYSEICTELFVHNYAQSKSSEQNVLSVVIIVFDLC